MATTHSSGKVGEPASGTGPGPPIAQYYTLAQPNVDVVPRIDVAKFPPPAIDATKKMHHNSESKYWVLGMDTSWSQKDLAKIDGLEPPQWWTHEFETVYTTKPRSRNDRNLKYFPGAKSTFEKLNMAGLNILQGLSPELKGDSVHQCGVLGLGSVAAMNTFLDTQGMWILIFLTSGGRL